MKPVLTRTTLCLIWLLAASAGFAVIIRYERAGGQAGTTPIRWPDSASVSSDGQRFTLLMFAHPQCPCTRASLEELNRLLAKADGRISARVLFSRPSKGAEDWTNTELQRSAAAIPGVTVQDDLGGREAARFGAETSGFVVLYSPRKKLLFKGGITASRGHMGDNAGVDAILSLLRDPGAATQSTAVYGCHLLGECEIKSTKGPQ